MSVVGISRSAAEKALEELRPLCEELPQSVIDPISLEVFDKPMVTRCGHTFERDSLIKMYDANPKINLMGREIIHCPTCRAELWLQGICHDKSFKETIDHLKLINKIWIINIAYQTSMKYTPLPKPPKIEKDEELLPKPSYLASIPECLPSPPVESSKEEFPGLPTFPRNIKISTTNNVQVEKIVGLAEKVLSELRPLCKELPDSVIDPISLEPLTEPMVLGCGHASERNNLVSTYISNPKVTQNGHYIIACSLCKIYSSLHHIYYDQSFKETIDHLKKIQEVFNKYVTTKQT